MNQKDASVMVEPENVDGLKKGKRLFSWLKCTKSPDYVTYMLSGGLVCGPKKSK